MATEPALVAHLKSPAHVGPKLTCPYCQFHFAGTTALINHVESPAAKCRMRDTAHYPFFIDQLTAGIVDVRGRHRDNTVRYIVNEKAADAFKEDLSSFTEEKPTDWW